MVQFFVTGTDTDAGKTLVTSALLYAARQRKLSTLGLKPIASGSQITPEGLRNDDALALQRQSVPSVAYATINPWAFAPAIAPHLAAKEADQTLRVNQVVSTLQETCALAPRDITLIEGAGGWRVPLNGHEDFSEIPRAMNLPVILVVGLKLGCLNHARLTAEAIIADGLALAGWVGSVVDSDFTTHSTRFAASLEVLENTLPAACLGIIPRLDCPTPQAAYRYLCLAPLLSLESV